MTHNTDNGANNMNTTAKNFWAMIRCGASRWDAYLWIRKFGAGNYRKTEDGYGCWISDDESLKLLINRKIFHITVLAG